ncbi:hypothetical protein ACFVH6_22205 [Spirillospora sp. NPDC127200]
MTEQTTPHIPAYTHGLRIAAAEAAAAVTKWTVTEQNLSHQFTEHQQAADAERAKIRAHLEAEHARAQQRFDALDEEARRLSADLAEAARRKDAYAEEAHDAQTMVLDWCTRKGIDPATLPPLPTSLTETSQPQSLPAPPVVPPAPPKGPAWMAEQDRIEDDEDRTRDDAHVYQAGPLTTRTDLPAGGAPDGAPFRPSQDDGGPDA